MGINSLSPQNMQAAGLSGIDRLAGNAMFPQSQMDKTQYSVSSQMPTSAEVVNSGYEPLTNSYSGLPMAKFAKGGLPRLAEGGTFEDQRATITDLYQKLLGRAPGEGEDIMQWKDYIGEGSPSEILTLADRLAQTEEGTAYGKSEGNKVFSNMVELTQKDSPFAGTENPYSNMKFLGGTQDPEGNPLYRFQDQNSGLMTVDASGQPIGYEPGRGWYDEQLRANPDAVRGSSYRNQQYLATGPLEKTYKFNGVDVPINAQEFQLDPKTGQFITGKSGDYAPVLMRDKGYSWFDDWGAPAMVVALPALAAAATYAAPYLATEGAALMGPTYGELGITGLAEGMAGPTYAEMGYTGLNQAQAIAQADAAAKSGFGLKDAYKTYQRANQIKNLLSGPSGGQQLGGLNSAPNASGYSAFDPGVRTVGLPIASGYEKTPWANMMPQISLSKLSEFAPTRELAAGGMTGLGHLGGYSDGGRLLKGPGDGMSDNIPATISDKQPARLADGEFVIPADVVSHLGNGSTDAGAKQLYSMMDKIRKARTGNEKQGKQINPNKFLPKG